MTLSLAPTRHTVMADVHTVSMGPAASSDATDLYPIYSDAPDYYTFPPRNIVTLFTVGNYLTMGYFSDLGGLILPPGSPP